MRRIIVKEVRPGMLAARSLMHPQEPGTAIITGGEAITIRHVVKFHELGVYDLWVNDSGLEFLDDLCCSQPTTAQQRLAEAFRESFFGFVAHLPAAFTRRHTILLQELVEGVLRTAPVIPCFRAFTEDAALLAHSCDVAVLSMVLGIQLENYLIEQRKRLNCRQARDVLNLTLGALFHDVGELMLPPGERESRLGAGILREPAAGGDKPNGWRQHTAEGFSVARVRLDPSAAVILVNHHQHFDGSGFAGAEQAGGGAKAQMGAGIHVHARIVMAADVFCQALFGDVNATGAEMGGARVPQPMVKALWQIQQMPFRQWFDPVVHQAILSAFQPFVEGMVVTLDDHSQSLVIKVQSPGTCYPETLRIGDAPRSAFDDDDSQMGGDQDRRREPVILAVDGSKVDGFLYGVRQSQPLVAA